MLLLSGLILAVQGTSPAVLAGEVSLDTGDGVLAGTLLVPGERGPWPVVLIIAGSGPTDRDGNSALMPGRNNSLRQLARQLAAAGVASLRYDKRGIGASRVAGQSEYDLRFGRLIEDARLWCRFLQADNRFSSLTVAGHSQGAQVGMNAAWLAGADGFVSLAGPGRPVCDLLREQLTRQLPIRGRVRAMKVLDSLEKGVLVEEPPPELSILFRPSVQPFLISWQEHDPRREIGRLDGPVAIVQGTTDNQVSPEDAGILAAAQPRARLVLLEGINHILKPVSETSPVVQQASLADSTLVTSPDVTAAIVELIGEAELYHREKQEALVRLIRYNGLEILGRPAQAEMFPGHGDCRKTADRVAAWARWFLQQGRCAYRFGLAEGGYVQQGRLVLDEAQDCVSFMYRCTELARAENPRDALLWALRTRFAGASPLAVVGEGGKVDYDNPRHLDFSLDMVRSGIWGRDITPLLAGAVVDTAGSSRYPAGGFRYVPAEKLDVTGLRNGDIAWLVLDPADPGGARLRREYGLVIGHLGIVSRQEGETWLIHAASKDLPGYYEGGRLVRVPLREYLARVGKFAGVVITRF